MSDDVLKKVVTYLRQIELVETGDLKQIALEAPAVERAPWLDCVWIVLQKKTLEGAVSIRNA